jgi:hypothetical protein
MSLFEANRYSKILPVRIESIVLDESHPRFKELGEWNSLGAIEYTVIDNPNKLSILPVAYPINSNIKNYPLINEIVYLIPLPDNNIGSNNTSKKQYYTNVISLWNHPHHNAYPVNPNNPPEAQQKDYTQTQQGSVRRVTDQSTEIYLGKTFKEKANVHPLLPFEGDFINEGRWGNSIRLGSTVTNSPSTISNNWSSVGTNGDPLTIIRNGQPSEEIQPKNVSGSGWIPITENINNDDSSIYLTSTQKIPLEASSISYVSYTNEQPDAPNQYAGKQIILNSGRLLFNTTTDHIMLSSAKSINLNAVDSVNIDTTKFITQADNIYLGKESQATEPLLLGNSTVNVLNILLDTLTQLGTALTSAVTTPAVLGAPSSIPSLQAFGPILSSNIVTLKAQLETIKSKRNFTV